MNTDAGCPRSGIEQNREGNGRETRAQPGSGAESVLSPAGARESSPGCKSWDHWRTADEVPAGTFEGHERGTCVMPHTYASLLVHCVFSTKERRPWLTQEVRERLWPLMGGIARKKGFLALQVGGTVNKGTDHPLDRRFPLESSRTASF